MKWPLKKKAACASQIGTAQVSTKWGRKVTLAILLVLITIWCWQKINNPATFPIKSIKIIDTQGRLNHQLFRNTVSPYLASGMLWINLIDMKKALLQVPWVAQVDIQRQYPDQLVITVTEQIPIAYWNNDELLNNNGNIFTADPINLPTTLPWLNGPDNQQKILWAGYTEINQLLAPLRLQAVMVTLSPRQVWQIRLNNGMSLILGRDDVVSRLKRFISVYPKLFVNQAGAVEYIDLRYSNGLAVKWKNNLNDDAAKP